MAVPEGYSQPTARRRRPDGFEEANPFARVVTGRVLTLKSQANQLKAAQENYQRRVSHQDHGHVTAFRAVPLNFWIVWQRLVHLLNTSNADVTAAIPCDTASDVANLLNPQWRKGFPETAAEHHNELTNTSCISSLVRSSQTGGM